MDILDIIHKVKFSPISCRRISKVARTYKLNCMSAGSSILLLSEYVKIFGRSPLLRLLARGKASTTRQMWPCCHRIRSDPISVPMEENFVKSLVNLTHCERRNHLAIRYNLRRIDLLENAHLNSKNRSSTVRHVVFNNR